MSCNYFLLSQLIENFSLLKRDVILENAEVAVCYIFKKNNLYGITCNRLFPNTCRKTKYYVYVMYQTTSSPNKFSFMFFFKLCTRKEKGNDELSLWVGCT